MTDSAQYATYVPTLSERLWRKLGFHYHLGDEPEGADGLTGWMCNESYLQFGFLHRLRFLLTGRLKVRTVYHFDTPSPGTIKTRLDWMIYYPGQPR